MLRPEQTAWEPPIKRASRPQVSNRQSSSHQAALHSEDRPHHTTDTQSRKPVRIIYTDDEDDEGVFTERRMPVVTKRYHTIPNRTQIREEPERVRVAPMRFFLIALGVILAAFVLAALIITFFIPALQHWNDDRTYGYPRTTHTRVNLGLGTVQNPYSDFTAENVDGYIYVFEVEETDPSQQRPTVYFIDRFSGPQKDLIAVTSITFIDQNGDGKPDMLVTMENGSIFVLYNTGKTFTATPPK